MGYWEEKAEYEKDLERKNFCACCGIYLNKKNTKGKCVSCEDIICNKCGEIKDKKIYCKDCLEGRKPHPITKLISKPFEIINENIRISQLPKEKRKEARKKLREKMKKRIFGIWDNPFLASRKEEKKKIKRK